MRWMDRLDEVEYRSLEQHGLTADIVEKMDDVTEEQWRRANAIVSKPDIPKNKFQYLDNCRIHVTSKVGYNNLDIEAWGRLGIPVCNVPNYGTREIADHAIALMLTFLKSIELHTRAIREDPVKNWRNALNPFGKRLSVATFGIVGLGRIGSAAALRAKAFGMDVVFYDPYLAQGMDVALGIRRVNTLEKLMRQSDVLSIHANLTEETEKMIDAKAFAAAKPGMIVINTARGKIIDIDALYEALKENKIAGAGLDVLPKEPSHPTEPGNPKDHPLFRAWCDNEEWIRNRILLTPHSAYFTPESVDDMRTFPIDVVAAYLNEGKLLNCVNERYLTHRR